MDDELICSDLCEEHGHPTAAAVLRAVSASGGTVYAVAERGIEYEDFYYGLCNAEAQGILGVFLDRDSAERHVATLTAKRLREMDVRGFEFGETTSLTPEDLDSRIGAILGRPFALHAEEVDSPDPWGPSPFPRSATDEQMAAIAGLFDRLAFYQILEVRFAARTP